MSPKCWLGSIQAGSKLLPPSAGGQRIANTVCITVSTAETGIREFCCACKFKIFKCRLKCIIKMTFALISVVQRWTAWFYCSRNMNLYLTADTKITLFVEAESYSLWFLWQWYGLACTGEPFSRFMNYGETDTPAGWCILSSEICPLSLSWLGGDCDIMTQNSFNLNMPWLSHTYISHVLV